MPIYQVKTSILSRLVLTCCLTVFILLLTLFFNWTSVKAQGENLGIHILHIDEINQVRQLYPDDVWRYVTVPLTLADLEKLAEWQAFFDQAAEQHLIPIIRLTTSYDEQSDAWRRPNKKNIVDLANFLTNLDWHQDEKLIIVFNEVNHAKEWGGQLDPDSYAEVLKFTANWFHSEGQNFKILPAAMDLAANNDVGTMEAFNYLAQLVAKDGEIFNYLDYWNSHSYPNPGFVASPTNSGHNSMRGFLYELDYLKEQTGRDFQVFITETGWSVAGQSSKQLASYYLYAMQHIWSDARVKGVTPFIMKGSPGPFAAFSFLDENNQGTVQLSALQAALRKLNT